MKTLFKIFYGLFGLVTAGLSLMLLANLFPVFGYQAMVVTSGSMEPAIQTGSAVIIHDADQYKIGDVITFHERGKEALPTTHRIVGDQIVAGQMAYITQGDANKSSDAQPVLKGGVLGRVVAVAPGVGYLLSMAKTRWGFVVLVGVPFLLVAAEEIRKIRKAVKKQKKT